MVRVEDEVPTLRVVDWLRSVGVLDFLSAWRDAFSVGAVLLAAGGVLDSYVWVWILDRLWMMGGAVAEPSQVFASCPLDSASFLLVITTLREQWFYLLCLVIPLLFLWSLVGGAVWRLLALRRSGVTDTSIGRALGYAMQHYWRGFFLTWALPFTFGLLIGAMLVAYGMLMAIPWVGDLVGGVLFFIPLGLGFLLAFGLLVLLVGGHTFGPGVAVGGAHGADAVTHCVSFVLTKPFRAIGYLLATCFLACVTCLVLTTLVAFTDVLTRSLLAFGEGIWSTRGESASDRTSQFLMACWSRGLQCIAAGAVVSVFFAGSVVSFLLLREAVDGTDRCELSPVGMAPACETDVEAGKDS